MHPLAHSLRSGTVAAAAATAMLLLTAPAALAGDGTAEVEVDHDCTSIDVTSDKAISNVVLEFTDGDTQRFEDLPELRTGTFAGTGDNAGDVITTAWIKSGNNQSVDGPGYGEPFDFGDEADDCASDSQTTGTAGTTSDDGPQGSDGDQDTTVSDTTSDSGDGDGGSDVDGAAADSANDDSGDDLSDGIADGETDGGAGTTAVANAATTTGDEATTGTGEFPEPRVLSGVLTATAEREVAGDVRSADASEIRSAGLLPNTGADVPVALAAALGALALGGGLLRRARHGTA